MSSRNEPCFCGSGKKTKKCHPDVIDIQSGSAFANLINLYDRVDTKIAAEAGNIRCRKGCFSCCHEHFNVSPVEFYFIIYNYYKRHGMKKVQEISEKGMAYWNEFKANHPKEAENLIKDATGAAEMDDKFIETMTGIVDDNVRVNATPCMFLDEETKACSIYEYRPLVCRTYGAGYITKMEQPFAMCEFIPDGLDYQKEMADLTEFYKEQYALFAIPVDEQFVMERGYPIFYFLKIQYNKLEVTLRKIDEYKRLAAVDIYRNKIKRMNLS